jgi:hypothetical protein
MANEAGSPRLGSTVDRDRSILALLEVGAAALLIGWFFLPWYSAGLSWGSYSPEALTTADLLIPFASLAAIVVTVVGIAMPARGAKIAILVAFVATLYGAMLDFQQVLARDAVPQPTAGPGLWLFTLTAASGVVLAGVDVARGGNSTFLWRVIRRPSLRQYGPGVAYVAGLAITLPVVAFPMFPQWWLLVWCAALLLTGPLWAVLARKSR